MERWPLNRGVIHIHWILFYNYFVTLITGRLKRFNCSFLHAALSDTFIGKKKVLVVRSEHPESPRGTPGNSWWRVCHPVLQIPTLFQTRGQQKGQQKDFVKSIWICILLFLFYSFGIETTNTFIYYSTIMSFYHIRSREQAKYEAVIRRSVLV